MLNYGSRLVYEFQLNIKGMTYYLIQQTGDGLKCTKSPSLEYDGDIVIDQVEIDQV